MPLTTKGRKVLTAMRKQYGKRAKEVFYASINKGVAGSSGWHNSPRRRGKPKTTTQRRARHKSLYGTTKLPPRGTGLKRQRSGSYLDYFD